MEDAVLVDAHTHIMWYPEHISEAWARDALAGKLVKMKYAGGAIHSATLDLHSYDSKPDDHWAATKVADKVVVFGIAGKASGVSVPNEIVAEYAKQHPDKLVPFASVDPSDRDCVEQLDHAVKNLKMKGLKLAPAYQHFNPEDRKHWPFFKRCEQLGLPIVWHQGATFPTKGQLKYSNPLQMEDVVMAFPDLRIIVAHLAHPWEEDLVVLMRKSPNLYADISAVHYRPWRYWQAMVTAMEYGVTHKIILASDYPSATLEHVIHGLRNVNAPVEGTNLPKIPKEIQDSIIEENYKAVFPEWG